MDSDNEEKINCDNDGEYRIYCHICDKLALDRCYNNNLKSQTHINNFWQRQQLNNTNNSTSFSATNNTLRFEKVVFLTKAIKDHPVILKSFFSISLYIILLDEKLKKFIIFI